MWLRILQAFVVYINTVIKSNKCIQQECVCFYDFVIKLQYNIIDCQCIPIAENNAKQ